MASWKCARCSTMNDESGISCSKCGLMRGSVVIQGAPDGPIGTESIPVERTVPGAPQAADGPRAQDAPRPADAPRAADALPRAAAAGDSPAVVPSWVSPSGEPTEAPPPVPLWKRIPLGGLLFAVLVIGGGISSWYFGAGRSDTGEIAKPGDLGANNLRVGDCYDLKDPQASEIEDVAAKPCTEAHEYELYFVGSMPEGAYPADAVFEQYVIDNCDPAFTTYVGKSYQESKLDIYWLIPTDASWRQGDRSVQCAVFDPAIPRLTGSLKGANR
jgi:hypothetical protein